MDKGGKLMIEKLIYKVKLFSKQILQICGFAVIFFVSVGVIAHFNSPSRYVTKINENTHIGYMESASGEYIGELIGYIRTGDGKIKFDSGETYSGHWENDVIEGNGILIYPENGQYEGEYVSSKRDGTGTFVWNNGDKYEGQWKADEIEGEGVLQKADGTQINGVFSANHIVSGVETFANAVGSYSCTLEGGTITKADISFVSGFKYSGEVANNVINGNGTMTYSSGAVYSGNFVNGQRSGDGSFKWTDGSYYVGAWSEDNMNGNGTYYYTSSSTGARLNGNFVNNIPNGECTYVGSDGKRYTTTWQNGKCVQVVKG